MPAHENTKQIKSRQRVADHGEVFTNPREVNVNAELTLMYWHIGERINREVLGNERAEYGKQIVATLSQQLQSEYGDKGFEKSSITRMMKFARLFPNYQIVATLSQQLQWSHFVEVIPLKNDLQREFYQSGAVHDRAAIERVVATPAAQRSGSCPPALGESH